MSKRRKGFPDETSRPATLEATDAMLRPLVEVVIDMEAPADSPPANGTRGSPR